MRLKIMSFLCAAAILFCAWISLPTKADAVTTNIKVAVECNLIPFQFIDDAGEVAGLHVDMMNAIAKSNNLSVEYIPFETTSDAVNALLLGTVDAILGVLPSDCSDGQLVLTNDISSATISLIANNKYLDLVLQPQSSDSRYTTAFELGTIPLSQVYELDTMYTVIVGDQPQLYHNLIDGQINTIIAVKESILYQFEHDSSNLHGLYTVVNNYMGTVNYSIMLRKNDRALQNMFNSSISLLRNSVDYDKMVETWLPNADLLAAQTRIGKLTKTTLLILGIAIIAVSGIYVWNMKLKSIVNEKTGEIVQQMQCLEQANRLRNLLIEHSPNSILLLQANGVVLLMNPRAEKVSNYNKEQNTKSTANGNLRMKDLEVFGDIWERINQPDMQRSMISSSVISLKKRAGETTVFRYQYYTLNADRDMVLMVEDVTKEERERTEGFEANKNQTLNRLIAGIAHEIKNPLMSIRAFASIIREQGGDEAFQASFSRYVPQEVDRINRLIESLINYARPVKGLQEHLDVAKLMEECVYLTHASAKDKRIKFHSESDAEAFICVNRDQVRQAIINLLINAIESAAQKITCQPETTPAIYTKVYIATGKVCVEVMDEGMGMSEETLKNCTEPFYTTKKTGTGMGLSLAKQFVCENKGMFEIESKPNEYTLITLTFEEDRNK